MWTEYMLFYFTINKTINALYLIVF